MIESNNWHSMDVSLIICTRNRHQQLARCLEAMRSIIFARQWELIIVDNGSTDQTAAVVQEFIKTNSQRTIYLFEPVPGKSRGLNTALKIAGGEILAFTDDDCYTAPDFLCRIWSAFEDPSVGYIGGRVVLHDPADDPIATNESPTPATFPAKSFVCTGLVPGANMAFRRRILLDIGGFDPLFGPGALFPAAEEAEVVARAKAIGWKGEYHPEVVVRHHHGRKAVDAVRLCKPYAIGRGAFHMKLLLRDHQFLWFARSIYQLRWRYKSSRTTILWEMFGAAKYTCIYLAQCLNLNRVGSIRH
jgi:glycosyltransferase involved in cell wall biosynthesis